MFCRDCIKERSAHTGTCPVCNRPVTMAQVQSVSSPEGEDADETGGDVASGASTPAAGSSVTQKAAAMAAAILSTSTRTRTSTAERVRLVDALLSPRALGPYSLNCLGEGRRGAGSTAQHRPSAKVLALLEFLEATRTKDPTIKTVVFSQWTSMLNVLEVRREDARDREESRRRAEFVRALGADRPLRWTDGGAS